MDLQSFGSGCWCGVLIFILALIGVSMIAGIKWQPVASAWF